MRFDRRGDTDLRQAPATAVTYAKRYLRKTIWKNNYDTYSEAKTCHLPPASDTATLFARTLLSPNVTRS